MNRFAITTSCSSAKFPKKKNNNTEHSLSPDEGFLAVGMLCSGCAGVEIG